MDVVYGQWKTTVAQDTSGWNLCDRCLRAVRPYLPESSRPAPTAPAEVSPELADGGLGAAAAEDQAPASVDLDTAVRYGYEHLCAGSLDDAIGWFEWVVEQAGSHAYAHQCLGVAHRKKGDLEKAMTHLQASLAAEPSNPESHYQLALCHRKRGRYANAVASLQEALRCQPDHARAQQMLADIQGTGPTSRQAGSPGSTASRSESQGLSRCRWFLCSQCGGLFEKENLLALLRMGGADAITGSRTCSNCGTTYQSADIYAGKHDVPRAHWPRLQAKYGVAAEVSDAEIGDQPVAVRGGAPQKVRVRPAPGTAPVAEPSMNDILRPELAKCGVPTGLCAHCGIVFPRGPWTQQARNHVQGLAVFSCMAHVKDTPQLSAALDRHMQQLDPAGAADWLHLKDCPRCDSPLCPVCALLPAPQGRCVVCAGVDA